MRNFGIGCFSFEQFGDPEEVAAHWAQEVEGALNSLPSVEDVKVGIRGFDRFVEDDDQPFDLSGYPLAFTPQPAGGVVSFRAKIPSRLHPALLPWPSVPSGENFFVQTLYGMWGPSTIVVCLDDLSSRRGGNPAVVLVREFLKSELKVPDGLRLANLGPSPFHIEGSIEPGMTVGFDCAVQAPGGFPEYHFTYDGSKFGDDVAALMALHGQMSSELSGFYRLVRYRNRRLGRTDQVASKAELLVRAHRSRGAAAALKRLFGTARTARELGLDILSAEFAAATDGQVAAEMMRLIYNSSSDVRVLREHLDREADQTYPAQLRNAREVVALLEGSRTKEVELAIVASSTLLGGLAGAAAALLAGG